MLQEEGEEVAVEVAVKDLQPNGPVRSLLGWRGAGSRPEADWGAPRARADFHPMSLPTEHARIKPNTRFLLLI